MNSRFGAALLFGTCILAAPASAQQQSDTTTPRPATQAPRSDSGSSTTGTTSPERSGSSVANVIDINSASKTELNSLPDIGAERADAIIANRPFATTEELVEKKILPKNVYDQINDRLVAR
jgi:DNA uptake protein ComE-like DNA-binding protein